MRFVRMLAAVAALACAGLSGQAQANVTIVGSATTDSAGHFSIPLEMTKLGGAYRLRFIFKTPFAVTTQITGSIVENLYSHPSHGFELKQTLVTPFASELKTTTFLEAFEIVGSYPWWRKRSDTYSLFTNPAATLNVYTSPDTTVPYSLTLQPVPEPATWALMILGFGAVGGVLRRWGTSRRPQPKRSEAA